MGEHLDSLPVDHPLNRSAGLDPAEFADLTEEELEGLQDLAVVAYVEPFLA